MGIQAVGVFVDAAVSSIKVFQERISFSDSPVYASLEAYRKLTEKAERSRAGEATVPLSSPSPRTIYTLPQEEVEVLTRSNAEKRRRGENCH